MTHCDEVDSFIEVKLNPRGVSGECSFCVKAWFLFAFLAASFSGCALFKPWERASGDRLLSYAKKEGGFAYTYGMADEWAGYKPLFEALYKKYGIQRSDIFLSSSRTVKRMDFEKNNPQVDHSVVGITFAKEAKEKGLLSCYKSTEIQHLPKWAYDQENPECPTWYATYYGTLGFMVNTDVVKEIPRSWEDLQKPIYHNMIGYLDPRESGTGVATVLSAVYAMGGSIENVQPGIDFFKKLHSIENIQQLQAEQNFNEFNSGQLPILMNYDYILLKQKAEMNLHAEIVIPSDGTVRYPYVNLVVKNPPHPATQRFLMDFFLSKEGQTALTRGYVLPVRADVKIPEDIAEQLPPMDDYKSAHDVEWSHAQEAKTAIEKAWDEIAPK